MSDVLKKELAWEFEGQSRPLAVCTADIEQLFSRWLELRALDKIESRKQELIERGNYLTLLSLWKNDVDADVYDWSGWTAEKSRGNEPGMKELLWLMFCKATPGMGPEMRQAIERIFSDPAKHSELFGENGLYWRSVALGRPTLPPTTAGKG